MTLPWRGDIVSAYPDAWREATRPARYGSMPLKPFLVGITGEYLRNLKLEKRELMGNNFYLHYPAGECGTCGSALDCPKPLHIGKTSAGWVFQWHETTVGESTHLASQREWYEYLSTQLLEGARILDEYHSEYDLCNFMARVLAKRGQKCPTPELWNGTWTPKILSGDAFVTGEFS